MPTAAATALTPPGGLERVVAVDYPVNLEFNRDYDVQNWRPLVNWLLAIPQWIVLYVLGIVAFVLWFVSLFVVLFTQRNPFLGFQTMYLRYYWRVSSFAGFMRNEYPPFDFATDDAARGGRRGGGHGRRPGRHEPLPGLREVAARVPALRRVVAPRDRGVRRDGDPTCSSCCSPGGGTSRCVTSSSATSAGTRGCTRTSSCSPTGTRRSASSSTGPPSERALHEHGRPAAAARPRATERRRRRQPVLPNPLISYWKKVVLENYTNFTGRARRAEFWWYFLANLIISIVLNLIDAGVGSGAGSAGCLSGHLRPGGAPARPRRGHPPAARHRQERVVAAARLHPDRRHHRADRVLGHRRHAGRNDYGMSEKYPT